MAVTINWDGVIDGIVELPIEGSFYKYYKVTDRFFSVEELEGYTLKTYQPINNKTDIINVDVGGNIFSDTETPPLIINYISGDKSLFESLIMSVSTDISEDDFIIEKGTYFGSNREKWPDSYAYVAELTLPNANEITAKPLTEITYNGQVIASLNAGETAILKCEGLPMETDITVKVNG